MIGLTTAPTTIAEVQPPVKRRTDEERSAWAAPGFGRTPGLPCAIMEHVPETAERTRRPPFKRGDQVDLTVDRLAYGGRGVGRAQGFVVFVPDSAPGDTVRARLARVKPGYAEAELLHVLRPSPMRTPPPCPTSAPAEGACGNTSPTPSRYAPRRPSSARVSSISAASLMSRSARSWPWTPPGTTATRWSSRSTRTASWGFTRAGPSTG